MTAANARQDKSSDTRQRLLLTALHLYAREGLHAVSLRRISTEAGSRNSAAMHYHFDNKPGVIQALIDMVTRELVHINIALRPERGEQRTLRGDCRNILRPLVELPARRDWGADGVRFLSRVVSEGDEDIAAMLNSRTAPFWQWLDHALAEQLPELPREVRRLRLMLVSTNVVHGVAESAWLSYSPLGDLSHFDEDTLLDHLVDYLIGGLQAPSMTSTESLQVESTP